MKGEALTSGRSEMAGLDIATFPRPPEWHFGAVCSQIDPATFYEEADAEHGANGTTTRAAKAICRDLCEPWRRAECLADAMNRSEQWGVWGGVSPRDRKNWRTAYRRLHGIEPNADMPAGAWGAPRLVELFDENGQMEPGIPPSMLRAVTFAGGTDDVAEVVHLVDVDEGLDAVDGPDEVDLLQLLAAA